MEIFITGLMCSGKTSLAEAFVNYEGFKRIPFAEALKEDFVETQNISLEYLEEHKGKYRSSLQTYGEDMKIDDKMYWCKRWMEKEVIINSRDTYSIVVDDMRFFHELEFAREREAFTVRVEVPEEVRLSRYFKKFGMYPTEEQLNHASERDVPKLSVDLVVNGQFSPIYNLKQIIYMVTGNL